MRGRSFCDYRFSTEWGNATVISIGKTLYMYTYCSCVTFLFLLIQSVMQPHGKSTKTLPVGNRNDFTIRVLIMCPTGRSGEESLLLIYLHVPCSPLTHFELLFPQRLCDIISYIFIVCSNADLRYMRRIRLYAITCLVSHVLLNEEIQFI